MFLKLLGLVLLVAVASSIPIDSPPVEPRAVVPLASDDPYRLPEAAVEVSLYDIELRVDDATFHTTYKFDGIAVISFTNLLETNEVVLHADVVISEVQLTTESGTLVALTNTGFVADPTTEILILTTATVLPSNTNYILRFVYVGDLRTNSLSGFYRSTYIDADGNERVLGTTQFESTSARKAFPSFDEPSYKAEFDIKIRHPVGYTAISNTQGNPEIDPEDENFIMTTFLRTPRMPTYLIAFVVSDFTCTQSTQYIDGTIPHFVCSREESAPTRELAVEYGPKLAAALESFTGIPYNTSTLTKLHQFAIPDFSAGAMENWGLITYRENYILWDPDQSSNSYKQNVITVIAHELAHYWCGNLVTTHWWSDIFLNEGCATYFEYHTPHEIEPSFELDKQFVIEVVQPVLVSDASPNSAPLSSPASTQNQISNRFSSISYSKGGSILRMVEHLMGRDNFKAGLNKYLWDNRFGNTRPEDLWAGLQNFAPTNLPAGLTIGNVMENWTIKPGYPIINVTTQNGIVRFEQKRFLSSGEPGADEIWYVPITYTTSSDSIKFRDTSTKFWLREPISINVLRNESDWIILNNQQTGYYRVDYDDELWAKIREGLNKPGFDGIHELNRAQLIDDFFNFVRYGRKSFVDLLELTTFLKNDVSYYPWYAAFNVFSYMTQRIGNERLRTAVTAYILELVEVLYSSIPFTEQKNDDQIFSYKKVLVIPWTCRLGLQDCVDNAVGAFASYKQTNIKPDKNLRATIYCNALRYSTNALNDFNFLWNAFLSEKLATEQVTILSALGCAKDVQVVNNYLSKSIDPNSGIRQQDTLSVFSSVYVNNPEGVDLAFDFLVQNYQAIVNFYGTMNSLNTLFTGLASRFTRKEQTDKFLEFIENGNLGEAETLARTALNTALVNLEVIEKFENELNLYFRLPESEPSSASTFGTNLAIITTLLVFCYHFVL